MNTVDSNRYIMPLPIYPSVNWYIPKAIIKTAIMSFIFLLNMNRVCFKRMAKLINFYRNNFILKLAKVKTCCIFARSFGIGTKRNRDKKILKR